MNFRRGLRREEPEINFIPLIDVLLVILIFLMVSTTYARFTELQVDLPGASAEKPGTRPSEIVVAVSAQGQYVLEGAAAPIADIAALSAELSRLAVGNREAVLVIRADAAARHQAVIGVLDAARQAGLARVSFAARSDPAATGR
ncbi:MAG: biopolymer transporter ExbD [Burkholderiaceae bacterium]|nr:biopolymer transporter ExbD [Burkholderiaceae bacterium]